MHDCTCVPPCPDFPAHQTLQRAAWLAAKAAAAKAARNRRTRWRPDAVYRPGFNRTDPPGSRP